MKALIVGLGSMGKRRARLLRELNVDVIGVDSNPQRLHDASNMLCASFDNLDMAIHNGADVAFVCTSPLSHHEIAKKLLTSGIHVFTELNLVNQGYEELNTIAKQKKLIVFPSSTWLYRKEMQYMISKTSGKRQNYAYTYHIGQYLPDWHPWESYKNYFIGDKKTNGCREIMALELPWLCHAFGPIASIHSIARKLTDLNIDYPDTYIIQIEHANGSIGSLMVDITSPMPIRDLEIIGEHLHLFWSGKPDTLFEFNPQTKEKSAVCLYDSVTHKDGYASFIIENAYADEIRAFLDQVAGLKNSIYSLSDDAEILKWIDKIEEANI